MEVSKSVTAAHLREFDIEGFKKFYSTFDGTSVARLSEFYSPQVVFKDPIHSLQGLEQLQTYFNQFCSSSTKCGFIFHTLLTSGNQTFIHWQMTYSHPALNKGKDLTLNGSSLITFDSRIYHQEDFYDMGAMLYQHVPVLGWIVKKFNSRLTGG
ncbi:MAG: nuclear transport factor 2 family protein [Moraxellaceae bacterium]|nr:MAG: nuclear transport factor 2 family protein [Moraxellaceae bacterium]